jgi:hypothetical protein
MNMYTCMCMSREVAKRQGLEWQLQVAAEESQRQEMFCHHAEQEVKRIAALVEVSQHTVLSAELS